MTKIFRKKPRRNAKVFREKTQTRKFSAWMSDPETHKPRKGIYLLPNAFTTAALFFGFFAVVNAMNQQFETAAFAVFISMVLDSLDGRVARLTGTQSEFGAQYDSLADMISFGAAPALIMYEWSLRDLGKMGYLVAFIYCAGAALRLARFNANLGVVDKRFFQGLPSPAAAALVAGFLLLMHDFNIPGKSLNWVAMGVTLFAGLSMVTNVPFYSFKDFNLKRSVPFIAMFIVVLVYVAIVSDPHKVLFGLFACYALSGYIVFIWRRLNGQPTSLIQTKVDEEHE